MAKLNSMEYSVEQHLKLQATEYDRLIRTFIPGYDEMHDTIAQVLAMVMPRNGFMIDLGGGTGSLAYDVAKQLPDVRIEIWDLDVKMLSAAEQRLSAYRSRVRWKIKSFEDPLPECDAVTACLSLHHIKELGRKKEVYSRIFRALGKPGIFLNGDITMNRQENVLSTTYKFWREFMKSNGMTEEEVDRHFVDWAEEDKYFSLDEELTALSAAGFSSPECLLKLGPTTVLCGVK